MTQIDQKYFEWLISQIHTRKKKTFIDLFERLHNTEFVWSVPNDDNRVSDGLELRFEFGYNKKTSFEKGVSVLEVIVALSRRCAFVGGGNPYEWAGKLLENLGLSTMFDPLSQGKSDKVEKILEDLIWRTYKPNGQGGFFPLRETIDDQTKVEIWYQMNAYVMENFD